ncbi:hypothetical protein HDK90DRAFT_454473 [Phyllosticta capitalensis]|uniref:Cep57 centrosome microtubule-binding domain-containing protein n=1 Tax=Phyllosticta capitalensis TaxID=121624 RepID=A0ABR1YPW8_9PEZI
MAPSSTGSNESRSKLIRDFAESLRSSRSSPLPVPTSPAHESGNNTNTLPSYGEDLDLGIGTSFDPELDNVPESTRNQFDDSTNPLPNIRSSAARYKYWRPPPPSQRIDTSLVEREFQDFSDEHSADESESIEAGRANNKSLHGTPSKISGMSPNAFSIGNDSLFNNSEIRNKGNYSAKKTYEGVERGNLRRDAQIRRATSLPQKDLQGLSNRSGRTSERPSPVKASSNDKRRNTLAQMHARLASEEDSSMIDERPPTVTLTAKNTRFGNPRSRQTSGTFIEENDSNMRTPQKSTYYTPRSGALPAAGGTQQSFMLPDIPNLTELVSGTYQDGTPVFSRSAKARSRFSSAPIPSRLRNEHTSKHIPIESVPMPADEKALFTSLQLLKDKVTQMEQDKAETEKKFEDYETQVAQLKAELNAQAEFRRSDSALGSTDGEGNKKDNWRVERTRLEAQVNSLRSRLERAERKMSVSDISSKRVTEERDNAVTQLGVAFLNVEELKGERDALLSENDVLRNEVDALRLENDELRARLAQYEQQSQQFQKAADRALRTDTTATRAELEKTKARRAEEKKLKEDNENLKAQVAHAKSLREEEARRRNRKEAELRSRIDSREDTIQKLQGMTTQEMNSYLRDENERLRVQMAELEAECEEDEHSWARKEARLNKKIEKSREATRDAQDITKELLSVRRSSRSRREKMDNKLDEAIRRASLPAKAERVRSKSGRRSLPVYVDSESEADSTTDLDAFSHLHRDAPLMSGAVPGLDSRRPQHTGDTTELSFMARDEVARLRKALEEERAAARKQSRAPSQTRQGHDETVRSQTFPRKSSMKDLTTASRAMDLTESNTGRIVSTAPVENKSAPASPTKQDTQRSILSNSGRRRPRSASNDLTSAFLLPDITIHAQNIPQPPPHRKADCTVCHKSACSEHQAAATEPSPTIPTPVAVSERVSADDIDATLRPTQPAPLALATVIKELQDELTHLNLQKAALDAVLRAHDASMAKRKRKAVEAKIAKLLKAISIKSDQIYALYDVVESQPYERQDQGEDEKEVEETLLSVGIDPEEMRERTRAMARGSKAKRVVIESVGERSEDGDGLSGLEDESELPWEGISETDLAV